MKMLRFATILALSLAASAAFAQDYARSGLYGQLNGVAAFEAFDDVPSDVFDTGIGVAGRLGYRFNPMFAVEGQLEYSGDFVDCCGADLSATLFTANARYYFLQEQVQPYAIAGIGGAWADTNVIDDESGFVVRFGGGMDWYLSESWGLTGEFTYNIATGDLDDFNYMSLGWGAFLRF